MFEICNDFYWWRNRERLIEIEQLAELSLDCASNKNHCKFQILSSFLRSNPSFYNILLYIMILYSSTFKLYNLLFKSFIEITIFATVYNM